MVDGVKTNFLSSVPSCATKWTTLCNLCPFAFSLFFFCFVLFVYCYKAAAEDLTAILWALFSVQNFAAALALGYS